MVIRPSIHIATSWSMDWTVGVPRCLAVGSLLVTITWFAALRWHGAPEANTRAHARYRSSGAAQECVKWVVTSSIASCFCGSRSSGGGGSEWPDDSLTQDKILHQTCVNASRHLLHAFLGSTNDSGQKKGGGRQNRRSSNVVIGIVSTEWRFPQVTEQASTTDAHNRIGHMSPPASVTQLHPCPSPSITHIDNNQHLRVAKWLRELRQRVGGGCSAHYGM